MLASPGVDLRCEDDSSVIHVSSLGLFNADGIPFQVHPKRNTFAAPTAIIALSFS